MHFMAIFKNILNPSCLCAIYWWNIVDIKTIRKGEINEILCMLPRINLYLLCSYVLCIISNVSLNFKSLNQTLDNFFFFPIHLTMSDHFIHVTWLPKQEQYMFPFSPVVSGCYMFHSDEVQVTSQMSPYSLCSALHLTRNHTVPFGKLPKLNAQEESFSH